MQQRVEISYRMVIPALLVGILLVSYTANYISHFVSTEERYVNTLSMKLPVDNAAITIPPEVLQFEGFDVSLQLATKSLAQRINDIVSEAPEGATIQGITGVVSPRMKAEIASDGFIIESPALQEQLIMVGDEALWTWRLLPEKSGRQALTFQLHLITHSDGQENLKIVDVAEANIAVRKNASAWASNNWKWISLLLLVSVIIWRLKRRFMA